MPEPRLIVTFHTTTEAIAWERVCKAEDLPGRLIPMPPKISAHCGLAWLTTISQKELLLQGIKEFQLKYDEVFELDAEV